jgi:hypothetical protein
MKTIIKHKNNNVEIIYDFDSNYNIVIESLSIENDLPVLPSDLKDSLLKELIKKLYKKIYLSKSINIDNNKYVIYFLILNEYLIIKELYVNNNLKHIDDINLDIKDIIISLIQPI